MAAGPLDRGVSPDSGDQSGRAHAGRWSRLSVRAAWVTAAALPLVGLVSLLLRSRLDPQWTNPRFHFAMFTAFGAAVIVLSYAAGEAADRRGDARVLLLS